MKRIPNDTRSLILETALKLFTEKGYFNTSVHDIKKTANISIGSIYHYFKSKEEIARALRSSVVEFLLEKFKQIDQETEDLELKLKGIAHFLVEMTETNLSEIRYILHARHQEFVSGEIPVCSSEPFRMFVGIVQKGIQQGTLAQGDPLVISACLLGGTIRLIQLKMDGVYLGKLEEDFPQIWHLAWKGVSIIKGT